MDGIVVRYQHDLKEISERFERWFDLNYAKMCIRDSSITFINVVRELLTNFDVLCLGHMFELSK